MPTAQPSLPDPIPFFPPAEQDRVREQWSRYLLLEENADDDVEAFIASYLGDRADTMGRPDISRNAAAAICRQVSTPGHYGRSPMLRGEAADAAAEILNAGQAWSLKQHLQYLAWGIGSCWAFYDWSESLGRVTFELVAPHLTWTVAHPDDPALPVEVYRLVTLPVKVATGKTELRYFWRVWSVQDPEAPYLRVVEAKHGGEIGQDFTPSYHDGRTFEGDDYPYRFGGEPFLPCDLHRARYVGDMYAWRPGRGLFFGTKKVMLIGTYADKTARDATGHSHLVANFRAEGTEIKRSTDGKQTFKTLRLEAGDVVFGHVEPGQQLQHVAIGAGGSLEVLSAYHDHIMTSLAVDMGITPNGSARQGANPMSGLALRIENEEKRLEQIRQEPLCRAADLSMIRKVGAIAGIDTSAVEIAYHTIDKSPQEEAADRDRIDWEVATGLRSMVDVYQDEHPGIDRETAIQRLADVARDRVLVEQRAAAMGSTSGEGAEPLNGAQVASATEIVRMVAAREIPRDAGVSMLQSFFQLTDTTAEAVMGTAGADFTPTRSAP